MDLTITIPDDVAEELGRRATEAGQTLTAHVVQILIDHVSEPTGIEKKAGTA